MMKSASEVSKMIRAKKKKMLEDQDLTDAYVNKMKEAGEVLSENDPKSDAEDELDPKAEMKQEQNEQKSAPDNTMDVELDNLRKKKHSKIKSMMAKMK